ncbi:unnamed protein product [Effrenium voratum]|uniref:Uncharacterized protein n=1 Tax=Effrenium voratum TaxID=2562239 RepID=A0AA36IV00_9DINO|nr:unnamed protein product [Effrenium voratum]
MTRRVRNVDTSDWDDGWDDSSWGGGWGGGWDEGYVKAKAKPKAAPKTIPGMAPAKAKSSAKSAPKAEAKPEAKAKEKVESPEEAPELPPETADSSDPLGLLCSAEKRGRAFELYQREATRGESKGWLQVTAVEVSLQAVERELQKLRQRDVATPCRRSEVRQLEPHLPEAPIVTPRRRWSRGRAEETKRPHVEADRREEPRLTRAASWDTGRGNAARRVPLLSLEQFLGQEVPNFPFA